ncbi:MAG: hypothetical protein EA409_02510 [Saprospirales bacterium]|nr:MAG: hypothetical protein EA409_02510 [Saprospirales bacterium]
MEVIDQKKEKKCPHLLILRFCKKICEMRTKKLHLKTKWMIMKPNSGKLTAKFQGIPNKRLVIIAD